MTIHAVGQLIFFKSLLYLFLSKIFPDRGVICPTLITTVYIMSYPMAISQTWEWTHQMHLVVYHFVLQTLSSHCLQGSIFLALLYLTRFCFSALWSLVIGFLRAQLLKFIYIHFEGGLAQSQGLSLYEVNGSTFSIFRIKCSPLNLYIYPTWISNEHHKLTGSQHEFLLAPTCSSPHLSHYRIWQILSSVPHVKNPRFLSLCHTSHPICHHIMSFLSSAISTIKALLTFHHCFPHLSPTFLFFFKIFFQALNFLFCIGV